MLVSILKGSYKIKLPINSNTKPNDNLLYTRQKDVISITKTRTIKADENFWKNVFYCMQYEKGNINLEQIEKP